MKSIVFMVIALLAARCAAAQPSDAVRCETEATQRKAAWASSPHSAVANTLETERQQLALEWCRAQASSGEERIHHIEDFGRVLFTGDGLHPVVGTVAPSNGLAGGATWNAEWNSRTRPLRFASNTEGRMSLNGSWAAGTALNVVGSAPSESNQHTYARVELRHLSVNEVAYFGPGINSGSDETTFGLRQTVAQATVVKPLGTGLAVYGNLAGLHASPSPAPSGQASADARFSDADAPGIQRSTTYVVFGAGAQWRYPEDEISTGYATNVDVAVRRFAETSGAAFDFTRTTAGWGNVYTPDTDFDAGTIAASTRVVISSAAGGNRVPVYLQPTLGGADIDGVSGLRGYRDYRFRAPDLWSATVEYTRSIRDPIGLLLFYDVGRVADRAGDLFAGDIRHSVGAGVTLRVGGFVIAEAYVAWGGEGSRFGTSGNTNALGTNPTARGVY